jgi:2,3-bisphosphoglycerate-dependent phosphoglycerate mutase
MYKVVIVRHGLSVWPTRFTGWTDIDLAPEGIAETYRYGKKLREEGFTFDMGFSSMLKRGIKTLWTVLDAMDLNWIPITTAWQLNERHYGALQGLNKAETVAKYGEEQVALWRRSYDVRPPLVAVTDSTHPSHDPRYASVDPTILPSGECLKDTYARAVPYWDNTIMPLVKQGKKIIVSAHGNSIRAIMKHLDALSEEAITGVNIPYCIPLVYEFDEKLQPIRHYYLASDEEVQRVIEGIKNQTKK